MASTPRPASIYSPDGLADARAAVTDVNRLAEIDPLTRARIVAMALAILRKDRALRLNLQDQKAEAVIIPIARFQFARRVRRLPAPHRVVLPVTPTPGDAA